MSELTEEEIMEEGLEQVNEPQNLLEKANKAVKLMKAENDRMEALIKRQEALEAQKMLGGRSDGGKQPIPPKEETPLEYKNRIMRGENNVQEKTKTN